MKNCVNCGSALDDAASVCNNCGSGQPQANFNQQPQGGYAQPMQPMQPGMQPMQPGMQPMQPQGGYAQPQQNQFADQLKDAGNQVASAVKKVDPKILIAAAAAVVLIILIVFVTKLFGPGSMTKKGAIEDYFEALMDQDGKAYMQAQYSNKMIKAIVKEEDYDSKKELYEEYEEEWLDYYYDDYKVKNIEIQDTDKLDKDDREDMEKAFRKLYDYTPNITAAYEVEIEYEEWDDWDEEYYDEEDTVVVYKTGGKWYVW